jgi:hypothetical protein
MINKPLMRVVSHCRSVWFYGFVVLCASAAIAADQEPSYNGRLLSQWLGDLQLGQAGVGVSPTEAAVRALGTNAIPTLLKWISYERPLSQQMSEAQATTTWRPSRKLSPAELAERSRYAFGMLNAAARPAIPELTRLARTSSDPERAYCCAASLASIGPETIPSLLSLATNSPPWTRYHAIGWLKRLARDPEAALVVPVLIHCLDDTNTYPPIDGAVEGVLLAIDPGVVIPALANALQSPSVRTRRGALVCLWGFQSQDATNVPPSTVPVLRAAMRDPDLEVRTVASNILRRMGGWELFGEEWVRRHGTNTLNGITPDFFTNAQSSNPQGGANERQPGSSETNQTSPAAASRRSP